MEQYRQITFKQAMEMIAGDKLYTLYFGTRQGMGCVGDYELSVKHLKGLKWYVRERIK